MMIGLRSTRLTDMDRVHLQVLRAMIHIHREGVVKGEDSVKEAVIQGEGAVTGEDLVKEVDRAEAVMGEMHGREGIRLPGYYCISLIYFIYHITKTYNVLAPPTHAGSEAGGCTEIWWSLVHLSISRKKIGRRILTQLDSHLTALKQVWVGEQVRTCDTLPMLVDAETRIYRL